ncbi:CinA family nicotinamide mononucleotide deamidase-related protein [Flavobacterium aciduliphilum]|uniref:CinA-like protein n=1 Tax=Flavobacterium aciduliphilum TaxID=1101402 RepID=A0A328YYM4_9FLAO|nr:CinA family nicotinamide mononucleotide deamidase-related protein [Flavobacterium aciduliphilum]RAR75647.1 nicotinamide-nucleotide amidase [Flavobacterium aciduliphilum]
MKAAIVTIGDEILIGQIVDTNSGFIAKELDAVGVQVVEMLSISDDKQQILETFEKFQNHVDLVVITGGLGPTKDDITKKTFCEYFDDVLIENTSVLEHVKELIERVFKRPITQMNKEQALVPSKCHVLFNKYGTAPGMWMKKEDTVYVSLPGVPFEMKYLIENEVVPKIVQEYKRPYIIHKTIQTYGQGESLVAERIETWENELPQNIKLAYLPAPGRVKLRLTARDFDRNYIENLINQKASELVSILSDIVVGYDDNEPIEVVVGRELSKIGRTLATAESCTGGKIAQMITSVPGASNYFRGSIVSYATDVKVSVLNVSEDVIKTNSVVSKEVAKEMALGVKNIMNTDYALATTGNAGPLKGDSDVEIGTVCIALATPYGVEVEEFNFGQPREKVIDRAVVKAFEMLRKEILKNV